MSNDKTAAAAIDDDFAFLIDDLGLLAGFKKVRCLAKYMFGAAAIRMLSTLSQEFFKMNHSYNVGLLTASNSIACKLMLCIHVTSVRC